MCKLPACNQLPTFSGDLLGMTVHLLCLQYEKLGMGKWYPGKLLLQNQDRKLGEC